jgi:hypothetical protein
MGWREVGRLGMGSVRRKELRRQNSGVAGVQLQNAGATLFTDERNPEH